MHQAAALSPLAPSPAIPTESLADKVPLSAAAVVLVGCGDGAISTQLRRRNPAVLLVGIEADPDLARRASLLLDEVFCLPLEPGPLPPLALADCIVVAPGEAEGWGDPGTVLAELATMLAPGGVLVIWLAWGDLAAQHRMLAGAGLHALDAAERRLEGGPGSASHIVWRTTAASVTPLRVWSTMLPPVGGVSQVRVVEPLEALGAEPAIVAGITNELDRLPELDGDAGILVLHRPALLGEDGLSMLRAVMARGWLVVCEFDDHPSQIGILHRSDVQNFRAVHAIQTSTGALAEVLRRENPEIRVFANAISRLPEVSNFADPGRINLMFAALNREEDWPGHVDVLNEAAIRAGAALQFHVIADRAFFDALTTPHKHFTPLCDYATYLGILARCEVSFMPLRDTLFNRCKSDLKYLEAAAHRAVALASPTVYAGSIEDGVNGLIFDSPQALHDRVMRLVADPTSARAMAERARADVARHRMLAYQMRRRTAWYRDLWARRDELHRALLERVPELA